MFEIEKNGVVEILYTDQPLNIDTVENANRQFSAIGQARRPRIVLDLSDVPLIDSRGLEWILELHETCSGRGGQLVLANPTPLCREIIEMTILASVCDMHSDVLAAIGSFN